MPYVYRVGQPLTPGKRNLAERGEYNYRSGEHQLLLCFRAPAPGEIQAVKSGEAEFALTVEQGIIFFLYRFGHQIITWSDAPYSWHMLPPEERALPDPAPLPEGSGALLSVMLVDAVSGLIQAIRLIGLSTAFSNALHAAIREQAAASFDQRLYDETLAGIYRRHPGSEHLLSRAVARYTAGAPEPPPRPQRGRPR